MVEKDNSQIVYCPFVIDKECDCSAYTLIEKLDEIDEKRAEYIRRAQALGSMSQEETMDWILQNQCVENSHQDGDKFYKEAVWECNNLNIFQKFLKASRMRGW